MSNEITSLAAIADHAYRLCGEIMGKSSLDHQRFAAQELKEAINNAALLINGLCNRPGPTLEERRQSRKIKGELHATAIAIPGRSGCVPPSKGHKTSKRQDIRGVGSTASR